MHDWAPHSGMRVLVADDDPVSLRFLELALRELGCAVCAVADGDGALCATAAATEPFDLMMLDRHMPGRGGAALLRALRAQGVSTPAVATSADLDDAARAELADAGYLDALAKPLSVNVLARHLAFLSSRDAGPATARSVRTERPYGAPHPSRLLDDDAAFAAIGDSATVKALRALLSDDLRTLPSRTSRLDAGLAEELHRLRAACRYCGARALEDSALALETTLQNRQSPAQDAWDDFLACCTNTRGAIVQDASLP